MIKFVAKRFLYPRGSFKFFKSNVHQNSFSSGIGISKVPLEAHYNHFINLKLPDNKVLATYIWIDGSGIQMRSKDRLLNGEPCNLDKVPNWAYDGSSTGQAKCKDSDIVLVPAAIYLDPFRKSPHVLILCETFHWDGKPTATNHRSKCAKVINRIADQTPWFGIEQEYIIFDTDLWPLGWPKTRGFPDLDAKFSYCGVGEFVAGREIAECHARACVYAGMDFGGSNAEVMKASWEFQVGVSHGIKAADDLWMGRYLLKRIAENFGAIISFHPKPMGKYHPGIGCHHNFSVDKMRSENGLKEIERVCKILQERHKEHIQNYGLGDGLENKKRLTGKFESASYDTCNWGVADRSASVRLQRCVAKSKKGYLEDRRPAGDCDPYRVCTLLAETCAQ